jgi:4-carboxymuconolactone decarboxylase
MSKKIRVAPLHPDQWDDEAHAAYAVLNSSATKEIGAASNAAMALAHYPKLAKSFYTLGRHILVESSLSDRLRELVTLRIGHRLKCGYEWYHHVRFAKRIGISGDEIEAVRKGPDAKVWSKADRLVLSLTDQLMDTSKVDDKTWEGLNKVLSKQQVMDLVFTVGMYVMMGWAVSTFQIAIETGYDDKDHPLEKAKRSVRKAKRSARQAKGPTRKAKAKRAVKKARGRR